MTTTYVLTERRSRPRQDWEEEVGLYPHITIPVKPVSPTYQISKRLLDIVGALLGLILLSPLFFILAILIKLDGGPIFYKQTRVGKGGKLFTMYKFRSMIPDADKKLAELQAYNMMQGPAFKMKNDPRITPIGHFIRKTSLDELPQLWNVLKGDMSLVGPRPPLPHEVQKYKAWQLQRLSVDQGLTCFWQISGRNNITFDEWMRLDIRYIKQQSFWLDLKLIFRTVFVVLTGKGAY